jgi:hypothetical protein
MSISGIAESSNSHFDIRPEESSHVPFHLWLALSNTKSTAADRHTENRRRPIAAALLKAVRVAKLVNIKPRIEGFYRNHKVHELKTTRYLAAEIDQSITGLAG